MLLEKHSKSLAEYLNSDFFSRKKISRNLLIIAHCIQTSSEISSWITHMVASKSDPIWSACMSTTISKSQIFHLDNFAVLNLISELWLESKIHDSIWKSENLLGFNESRVAFALWIYSFFFSRQHPPPLCTVKASLCDVQLK